MAPELVPLVEAARATVQAAHRNVREVACAGGPPRLSYALWKLYRYSVNGEYAIGIGVYPSHAAIYFNRGVELDDPKGLLEGGGKVMRFLRIRSAADARSPAVKRLVKAALELAG